MKMQPSNKKLKQRGFTLIELLVVISIISVLSAVVLTTLTSARNKARYARANAEINGFIRMAIMAQGEGSKTLLQITGSGCSDCACRSIGDIKNISSSHACYTQWASALTNINTASNGNYAGLLGMTRDPWGSPYLLDENERESGPSDCRNDTIRSAGPNGIAYDADDVGYIIPLRSTCP